MKKIAYLAVLLTAFILAGCTLRSPAEPSPPPVVPTQNSPVQTPEPTVEPSPEPTTTVELSPEPTRSIPEPSPTPTQLPSLEPTVSPTPSPTPVVAATPEPPCQIKPGSLYTIQPGDNLSKIAECAYGDPTRWVDIFLANTQLSDPRLIHAGNSLIIPHGRGS